MAQNGGSQPAYYGVTPPSASAVSNSVTASLYGLLTSLTSSGNYISVSTEPPSERHRQITESLMAELKAQNQFESAEDARLR